MEYVTKKRIEKVARDVALVKKEARVCIVMGARGIEATWNKPFRLNVIAIIGAGCVDGVHCNETLLCEVGISRVCPYRIAELPKGTRMPEETNVLHRRKAYATMTREQYLFVAPTLFSVIQQIVDEMCAARECDPDNAFTKWVSGKEVAKRCGRITESAQQCIPIERGIKFSVYREDALLVSDVYAAELFYNRAIQEQIKRAEKLVAMYVRKFEKNKSGMTKAAHEHFREEILETTAFPRYLWMEVLERAKAKRSSTFFVDLVTIFEWTGEPTEERRRAMAALPGAKERLQGIRLRIGRRINTSNIMFEAFASPEWRRYKPNPIGEQDGAGYDDEEVPF